MARIKHWDGTKWVIFDARDSDTVDGKHAADFAPIAHVGSSGNAHALVTTSVHGFMSAADKDKLNTIQRSAQVNQMAIRHIMIDTVRLTSNVEEGEVKFVSGTNIALTPDASTNTVTVGVTGTVNNADKVDGFHASSAITANQIPVRDANGKVPGNITGDADTLDGYHANYFSPSTHVHAIATATANGFMAKEDRTKLDGIQPFAEVNQNAFSSVIVTDLAGNVKGTFDANAKTDNFTFVQGVNVTLTPDTTKGTIQLDIHDPMPHNHDERYYTEAEINSKLATKSDITHNHDGRYMRMDTTTDQTMNGNVAMGANDITFTNPNGGTVGAETGKLHFRSQTDTYEIFVHDYSTTGSRMIFNSSDDGAQDYFLFRHHYYADAGPRELLEIRYSEVNALVPLKQNGSQVWHAGNFDPNSKANASHNHDAGNITSGTISFSRLPVGTGSTQVAAGNHNHDGSYVNTGGDTMTGQLTITRNDSHIKFIEGDTGKNWHFEVNGNNFKVVETGVAVRLESQTGGGLLVSGNEVMVKYRNFHHSTAGPSGGGTNGDVWIQY